MIRFRLLAATALLALACALAALAAGLGLAASWVLPARPPAPRAEYQGPERRGSRREEDRGIEL